MNHQQADVSANWPLIKIGRGDESGGIQKTGSVNLHELKCNDDCMIVHGSLPQKNLKTDKSWT